MCPNKSNNWSTQRLINCELAEMVSVCNSTLGSSEYPQPRKDKWIKKKKNHFNYEVTDLPSC